MHKEQSAQYSMFHTIQSHFNRHSNAWNTNVPITVVKEKLDANITLLRNTLVIQLINTTGVTENKKTVRERVEKQAFILSSGASAYALITENDELLLRTNYKSSYFKKMRDAELQSAATNLVTAVQPFLAALAPFGIILEMLETLTLNVNLFAKTIILPKETVKTKKEATEKMVDLIKKTSVLLKTQLDALVVGIEDSEPEFVAVYKKLRRLRKPNRTQLGLTTTVIDALTKRPIEGALLEVTSCKIKRVSSAKGRNMVKNIAKGRHQLKVSHREYKAVVKEFTVIKGETTKLVIELEGME